MKNTYFIWLFLIIAMLWLASCKVFNPSQMLRTNAKFKFADLPKDTANTEYKIAKNDNLELMLFANDGEKLMDPINLTRIENQNIVYTVESDGKIKLPLLGQTSIAGLTIKEAETELEKQYANFYRKPFVKIKVINKRVIVFPGGQDGKATVIPLTNVNTTLFEALAQAGGINDGKAHKIKLIRTEANESKVYHIDLSTIAGMQQGNLVLQANDVIYVQPRNRVPEKILQGITPYVTLLSTILLIYGIVVK